MSGKTVLLISANCETAPCPVYPLALARLAGAVRRSGHQARLFDVLVHDRATLPAVIEECRPDLVGLSLRNIDNTDSHLVRTYVDEYRRLADSVRRHTSAPMVLGGSGFSLFPQRLMSLLGADFGVVGPGEQALCDLLEALDGRGDVAAIGGLLTAQSPPAPPARSAPAMTGSAHCPEMVDYYWKNGGMIGIQTKRGCPKSCSYCTYPLIDGRSVQWADPGQVADDIERLVVDRAVRYFFMVDSIFNLCPERECALAREIARRSLSISWGAFFSPAGLDREYLQVLQRSGLTHVELGTDSLSDPVLQSYNKDFCVQDAMRASDLCAEMGLYCAHYLIFGGPGETAETMRQTVSNAQRLSQCVFFPLAGVRVYPGTAVYDAARARWGLEEDDCLAPVFYFSEALTSEHIWQLLEAQTGGSSRWLTPSQCRRLGNAMRRLRHRGVKGPLWEYADPAGRQ